MRPLLFAFFVGAAALVAACSSPQLYTLPTPAPTSSSSPALSSTVAFTFTVPTPAPALRKRNITLPSNASSVKITLDSVDGSPAPSSSPTIANLTSSTSGCSGTNPLTCTVDVTAPVGTLVYTITVYGTTGASGTPVAEGDLSVTTTANTTTTAPSTLSGTISKIVITMGGAAEEGAVVAVPVVIQAEDSNGYTILGTYSSPITLSDTDASGQTSLSTTNVPDSTTAAGVTLNYQGGIMSGAATIGATASGVSASNITTASFMPDATYPTVASSAEFGYSGSETYWQAGEYPEATDGPNSYNGTYSASIAAASPTASPFLGISNLVSTEYGDYYAWSTQGATQLLSYVGYFDGSPSDGNWYYCAPGSYIEFEVPVPSSSWSAFANGAPCSYTSVDNSATSDPTDYSLYQNAIASNGSYDVTYSYNYTYSAPNYIGNGTAIVDASGDGTVTSSDPADEFQNGSYYLYVQAPTSDSATVNASFLYYAGPSPLPSPLPSATPVTAPNPWQYVLSGTGAAPSPLQSDVFTNKGTIAATSLPAGCTVTSGIIPSGSSLTHIQEVAYFNDPIEWNDSFYYGWTEDYYYLSGVGLVCDSYYETYQYFEDGALGYYDGVDATLDGYSYTETDYLTSTSLTAQLAHARSMTAAAAQGSALFAAAVHAHHVAMHRQQLAAARKMQMARRKQLASKRN